jgi:Serine/threonine protein kinase
VTWFLDSGARAPDRIGEYRIVRRLGMGGQGAVFLAESPTGTRVAIKVLHARFAADPDDRRRFLREAQVAASVAPFCTARVIGTGVLGAQPYIVSEYVPGPSLVELVRTEGPRTGGGLYRLAISTLTALASIHQAGIVHRDLKPGNVILGPEGPVVIDFGIARAQGAVASSSHVYGTPAFMSPELLFHQPATPASDIFSWGVTMVFAATGRVPFGGDSVSATLHSVLHAEPDLTGMPEPLRTLVAACLAKNPADRPAAEQLLRELTSAQGVAAARAALGVPEDVAADTVRVAKRVVGDTMPPALSMAATDATGLRKALADLRRSRRSMLVGGAALAVLAGATGGVALRALFAPALDLTAYASVDVYDDFDDDPYQLYRGRFHQPFPTEGLPESRVAGGRLIAEAPSPFFGWFTPPGGTPAADDTVTLVTLGLPADTGAPQDSVFVGRIRDANNYVAAWYNNTVKEIGIDVRVDGRLLVSGDGVKRPLRPGDQLALVVSRENRISAYARIDGTWERVRTVDTAIPGSEQERREWLHGFALRATHGRISLEAVEGRSGG